MSQTAELLSLPVNFAVVQLPDRRYPGVVVQGDTLNRLVNQLADMSVLLTDGQTAALAEEIEDMRELLAEALAGYESVCAARAVDLPYRKRSST
jgi:signal transduction histidine kinase